MVLREKLKGAWVTGAPELLPSTLNCTLVVLEETLVVTVVVPETVAPESGEVIEIVGAVDLLKVSETAALVVVCPAELLATAESEWVPLESVVVFREKLKGALVTGAPELLPSNLNCTLVVLAETLVVDGGGSRNGGTRERRSDRDCRIGRVVNGDYYCGTGCQFSIRIQGCGCERVSAMG